MKNKKNKQPHASAQIREDLVNELQEVFRIYLHSSKFFFFFKESLHTGESIESKIFANNPTHKHGSMRKQTYSV